jgi:hypothetical protein
MKNLCCVCVNGPWIKGKGFARHDCLREATTVYDGRPYCLLHNPERVAAREQAYKDGVARVEAEAAQERKASS